MAATRFIACPTDIVEAPVDIVWELLTHVAGWGRFFDLRVVSVEPPGPAAKGQRMLGETGPRWLHRGSSFEYTLIDTAHYKLEMDVRLSLGLTFHEALDCVPLEAGAASTTIAILAFRTAGAAPCCAFLAAADSQPGRLTRCAG